MYINHLEKLEAVKAAAYWVPLPQGPFGPSGSFWVLGLVFACLWYWALISLTGPYWVLGLTWPYWALLSLTEPYLALLVRKET